MEKEAKKEGFFDAKEITSELLLARLQEMSGRDLMNATRVISLQTDGLMLKQMMIEWQAAVIAYVFEIPVDDVLDLPSKKLYKLGFDVQTFFLSP